MDRLLVSLLNTALDGALESPLSAARWWASLLPDVDAMALHIAAKPRFSPALLAEVRLLRDVVAGTVSGSPAGVRFSGEPGTDAVLFPLAHAAAAFLSSERAGRLKTCVHEPCGRYFLDETKNGSRRWCSLRCMERARAPRRRTIAG